MSFDGFLPLAFHGLLLLAEGFLHGAVALLIIEFVEIVGFAFAKAAPVGGWACICAGGAAICLSRVLFAFAVAGS